MKALSILLLTLCVFQSCDRPNSSDPVAENPDPAMPSATREPADPSLKQLRSDLQGTWHRIDYPFGTLEFRENELRDDVGEGMAKAPQFRTYILAADCPEGKGGDLPGDALAFILIEDTPTCNGLQLRNDTLSMLYDGNSEGIMYTHKPQEGGASGGSER